MNAVGTVTREMSRVRPAVVVPVVSHRGNAVNQPSHIDGDDDEVGNGVKDSGDFAIERSKAVFMIANPLLVNLHMRAVVGCTNMEEGPRAGFGLDINVALVKKTPS